jgi:hypothetical protein
MTEEAAEKVQYSGTIDEKHTSGAKQAAEKLGNSWGTAEKLPSAAKAGHCLLHLWPD